MPVKRIDHVGVIVDNLESASRFLTDVLGFEEDRKITIPGRLNAAFFRGGDFCIELVEIVDAAERERRLGSGVARIEHLALEVEDVTDAIGRLREKGVVTTIPAAAIAGPFRSFFTRPETTHGVTYQIFDRQIDQT